MNELDKEKIEEIKKHWETLKKEAKEDLDFSPEGMEFRFDLTQVTIKWLGYLQDWKKLYINYEKKRKNLQKELLLFYKYRTKGGYEFNLETKDEVTLFIETDERYEVIYEKCQLVYAIMEYCTEVMDKSKNKVWEIKNWIEYQKLIHGK